MVYDLPQDQDRLNITEAIEVTTTGEILWWKEAAFGPSGPNGVCGGRPRRPTDFDACHFRWREILESLSDRLSEEDRNAIRVAAETLREEARRAVEAATLVSLLDPTTEALA